MDLSEIKKLLLEQLSKSKEQLPQEEGVQWEPEGIRNDFKSRQFVPLSPQVLKWLDESAASRRSGEKIEGFKRDQDEFRRMDKYPIPGVDKEIEPEDVRTISVGAPAKLESVEDGVVNWAGAPDTKYVNVLANPEGLWTPDYESAERYQKDGKSLGEFSDPGEAKERRERYGKIKGSMKK